MRACVRASEDCSEAGFKLSKADDKDDDDERVDELSNKQQSAGEGGNVSHRGQQ